MVFLKLLLSFLLVSISTPTLTFAGQLIGSVSISSDHFNPTAGQRLTVWVDVLKAGKLTVQVLDRDGYLVKTLAAEKEVSTGKYQFEWIGDTDQNFAQVVADEAYNFRVQFIVGGKVETYFPANQVSQELNPKLNYYDRKRGIISFEIKRGGRVHLQAGIARVDEKKKTAEGCVMKTITNRSPRGAGNIAEFFDGFADGDKSIYIPDLPNFKIAIAATALPENSVITVGSKGKSFAETVITRKGKSLFTFMPSSHHHHQGLSTLDDLSPNLAVRLKNGTWSDKEKIWYSQDSTINITGELHGPGAEAFSKQPGRLLVFIGEERVLDIPKPISKTFDVKVPLKKPISDIQILTVNTVSLYGPVGVHALRFRTAQSRQSITSKNLGKKE